jgi:hypothetical protein
MIFFFFPTQLESCVRRSRSNILQNSGVGVQTVFPLGWEGLLSASSLTALFFLEQTSLFLKPARCNVCVIVQYQRKRKGWYMNHWLFSLFFGNDTALEEVVKVMARLKDEKQN